MFHRQENTVDNSPIWLKAEKEWREKNEVTLKKRGFICNKFLTWIVQTKKDGKFSDEKEDKYYTDILWMVYDIMIRKLLTSKKYIVYNQYHKEEMYQDAMMKLINIPENYKKGSAFTFITTVITSAFKDVIQKEYKFNNNIKELRNKSKWDSQLLYDEVDPETASTINTKFLKDDKMTNRESREMKQPKTFKNEQPTIPDMTRPELAGFYDDILEEYMSNYDVKTISLLTHPNLPLFKRKFKMYTKVLVPKDIAPKSKVVKLPLEDGDLERCIVVELIDLEIVNEQNNQHKNLLSDRVHRARFNGLQYFGIFSDDWFIKGTRLEETEDVETVRNMFRRKLRKMIKATQKSPDELPDDIGKKRYVALDYIRPDIYREYYKANYKYGEFWGLDKDRDVRVFLSDVDAYIKWLDADTNNTRTYGFGYLDLRKVELPDG